MIRPVMERSGNSAYSEMAKRIKAATIKSYAKGAAPALIDTSCIGSAEGQKTQNQISCRQRSKAAHALTEVARRSSLFDSSIR